MEEIVVLNNPLIHSIYDLVPLIEMYKQDAINIFNYLNGKVNKMNICRLSMCLFSNMNYAQFQYPNSINIFLGSIVDHFADMGRDTVLSAIAMCTSHELFHADQEVNGRRYKANAAYCKNVEDAAQYNAEVFCYSHRSDFMKQFGFKYETKVQSNFGNYVKASYKEYYANAILGLFRSEELYTEFVKRMLAAENFAIALQYGPKEEISYDMVIMKRGGVIMENQVTMDAFVNMLNEVRRGIASCVYYFSVRAINQDIGGAPFDIFQIEVEDLEYNPILFG